MNDLVCDDCGTLNPKGARECELCGASLEEEREEAERASLVGLLFGAVVATILSFVGGAVAAKLLVIYIGEAEHFTEFASLFGPPKFTIGYSVAWLLAVLLAPLFSPKRDYDFGGKFGNPFSLRDDYDRTHAGIGCILAPLTIVHGLWRKIFERLAGD